MELYVLASDKNHPIVGEKLEDGTVRFDEKSYYQPAGYCELQTKAGVVVLPVFSETVMLNHDDLQWLGFVEFLRNDLIVKANGFDRETLDAILSSNSDELDEWVHEVFAELATAKMSETDDEEEQENILLHHEHCASDVNNQGDESKLLYLLCA